VCGIERAEVEIRKREEEEEEEGREEGWRSREG